MAVTKCCCFDLRTGTLILLWIQVLNILGVFQIFGNPQSGVPQLIGGIAGILGLYGVYKEKPDFLWPVMILNIIGIVGLVIMAIFLPFVMAGVASIPSQHANPKDTETALSLLIFMEIVVIFAIVLSIYFYKVIKAYFNQMNSEIAARNQNVHANNMERGIYPKV